MNYRTFVTYNVVGGALWVWSMIGGGYFLAHVTEHMGLDIRKHLHLVILVVIFLSILPGIIEFLKERRRARTNAGAEAVPEAEG